MVNFRRFSANFRSYKRFVEQYLGTCWTKFLKIRVVNPASGALLATVLLTNRARAESSSRDVLEVILVSDRQYEFHGIEAAYKLLAKYENSTSDPELLWRLARIFHDIGKNETDHDKQKKLLYRALKMAEKAVANEPETGSWRAHYWYACCLFSVGLVEGRTSLLKKGYEIKSHFERALELNPNNSSVWHWLGLWHFKAADMSGYERLVTLAIHRTSPCSTYEDATAERLDPNFYKSNLYYMAETLERLGRKSEAVEIYKKAFGLPMFTKDDYEVHCRIDDKLKLEYKVDTAKLPIVNSLFNGNKKKPEKF